jgi:hypothetical protein
MIMNMLQKTLVLVSLIAVPAGAQSFFATPKTPCFTAGSWTYQLSSKDKTPDYRIKIQSEAATADLRMQMVDAPETADFVIADDIDSNENNLCKAVGGLKTVRIDADETTPDVTVMLSRDAATPDYKLYVHSARFSHQDAAALLAVMWKSKHGPDAR